MFPRKAAVVAALAGAALYSVAGWSGRSAVGAAVALFLCFGGARYIRLLTRVLPRDVRWGGEGGTWLIVDTILQYGIYDAMSCYLLTSVAAVHVPFEMSSNLVPSSSAIIILKLRALLN